MEQNWTAKELAERAAQQKAAIDLGVMKRPGTVATIYGAKMTDSVTRFHGRAVRVWLANRSDDKARVYYAAWHNGKPVQVPSDDPAQWRESVGDALNDITT